MNKIEFGDCREIMKRWIDEGVKVQTCITSPPYYGLRDYGTATWEGGDINCDHKNAKMKSRYDYPMQEGSRHAKIAENTKGTDGAKWYDECPDCGAIKKDNQIGLEQTPKEYIENMVDVFNHVKELLADDGTLWVNIGDSYSSHKDCKSIGQTLAKGTSRENAHAMELGKSRVRDTKMLKSQGLKNKDLIGIPWMLAFALREAGWYLRQDIIWHKPNPMPESVTDRCTKSHEYIFLLSKSDKYYFDHVAIKEQGVTPAGTKGAKGSVERQGQFGVNARPPEYKIYDGMRNKRDVWSVNVRPYKGAHFATYPTALIEPCVLAGSPEKICVECNTPYKRQTKIERNLTLEEVEQIRNNIIETNKEKKPYAIIDKEFRNQVIEYRNLPNHDELREYLQSNRNLVGLTIDQIETAFGTQAPHHWFEKGGSYPDKEDWLKLKQMLLLDDKYDVAMTEIFYKSGLKCDNKYLDEGLVKQCKCDTNETKSGIVFDPFMGSGTTAQVALQHGRQYLGCELNKEYEKLQQERINHGQGQLS
jgi:DNA modification methylase